METQQFLQIASDAGVAIVALFVLVVLILFILRPFMRDYIEVRKDAAASRREQADAFRKMDESQRAVLDRWRQSDEALTKATASGSEVKDAIASASKQTTKEHDTLTNLIGDLRKDLEKRDSRLVGKVDVIKEALVKHGLIEPDPPA